jgi:hypothetical protein
LEEYGELNFGYVHLEFYQDMEVKLTNQPEIWKTEAHGNFRDEYRNSVGISTWS